MQTAARDLAASLRSTGRARSAAAAVLLAGFLVAVSLVALGGLRGLRALDDRRDEALAARPDPAAVGGDAARAFRRFRTEVGEGERFALVFSPDVGRDQEGFYRLVALSLLYPAVATADPARADAVMAFGGAPTASLRAWFREIAIVDGVWLGRRQR